MFRHAFLNTFKDAYIFIYLFLTKNEFDSFKFGAVTDETIMSFILLEHYNDKLPGVLEGYSTL